MRRCRRRRRPARRRAGPRGTSRCARSTRRRATRRRARRARRPTARRCGEGIRLGTARCGHTRARIAVPSAPQHALRLSHAVQHACHACCAGPGAPGVPARTRSAAHARQPCFRSAPRAHVFAVWRHTVPAHPPPPAPRVRPHPCGRRCAVERTLAPRACRAAAHTLRARARARVLPPRPRSRTRRASSCPARRGSCLAA
jgi:hypothetical protein